MIRRDKGEDKPDVTRALSQLERVKRQRPEVERLVETLRRERQLNNFASNIFGAYHGRSR